MEEPDGAEKKDHSKSPKKKAKKKKKKKKKASKRKGKDGESVANLSQLGTMQKFNSTVFSDMKDGQMRTIKTCLLYTSPSPRDATLSRMPSSA